MNANQFLSKPELATIKPRLRKDAKIGKASWFKSGGNCDILFRPETEEELSLFLQNLNRNEDLYFIGACSNILIRDKGVRGVVIKLGDGFSFIKKQKEDDEGSVFLEIGCATPDITAANFCLENNLSGLEFLSVIPGTIGGNIAMNAGCYGHEIANCLESVTAFDKKGSKLTLSNADFNFSYRKNPKKGELLFTSAVLRTKKSSYNLILEKMDEMKNKKDSSQPTKVRTSGSAFINPKGIKAWELIDQCDLRGFKVGDAQISEKHANFLVNNNNATSKDIEDLGKIAIDRVKNKFDIELQWEIEIIGQE